MCWPRWTNTPNSTNKPLPLSTRWCFIRWAIPTYSLNLLELFNDPIQVLFQPVQIDVNQLDAGWLERFDWLTPATELMRHIRDEDITLTLNSTV